MSKTGWMLIKHKDGRFREHFLNVEEEFLCGICPGKLKGKSEKIYLKQTIPENIIGNAEEVCQVCRKLLQKEK